MGAFGDPRVPGHEARRRHPARRPVPARPLRQLPAGPLPRRPALPPEGLTARETSTSSSSARTPRAPTSARAGISRRERRDEVAVQEDVSTRKGVERIIRYAFEFASARGRRRVVMSDKSNAMRFVGDLWQRTFAEVAREYPGDRGLAPLHRRALHADGQGPAAVRGHRDQQHVRRHRDRSRRGAPGRPRDGGVRQPPSRARLDVRAGARLRAEVRRDRQGQPVRRDPHGRRCCSITSAMAPRPRPSRPPWRPACATAGRPPTWAGSLTTSAAGDAVAERLRFD